MLCPGERALTEYRQTRPGSLPPPAIYHPFSDGRYSVKPNLFKLGFDFGNPGMDGKILQLDNQFHEYREQKLSARKVNIDQYFCEDELDTKAWHGPVNKILADLLVSDYPQHFRIDATPEGWRLHCNLSQEILAFNINNRFVPATSSCNNLLPGYRSGIDALACQFQEDICVLGSGKESDRLVTAHLCFPNRWSPAEKIGGNFATIHQPVAGFNSANPRTGSLVRALLHGGPYVRFAWGLSSDRYLDHHPSKVTSIRFKHAGDPLFVRIERQVLYGLPGHGIILFFIRTYFLDCQELCNDPYSNRRLGKALDSMNDNELAYKGLDQCRDQVTGWLASVRS